jgi:hypothetical protein
LKYQTAKPPILGKNGNYSSWMEIPNVPGDMLKGISRYLSISPHATLEIIQDNNERLFLVFPVSRLIIITYTRDNRNNPVWITEYNEKDPKQDSEYPETNPDEEHR